MFDLDFSTITMGAMLLCIIPYYYVVFHFRKQSLDVGVLSKRTPPLLMVILILCAIIFQCLGTDFFNYQELVHTYDLSDFENNYAEPIYGYIVKFTNKNYFLFRLVVWGCAFILLIISLKLLEIDGVLGVYLFFTLYLFYFSYARVSLALAVYFCGASLLFTNKGSKIKTVLGLLLIIGSFAFHNSIIAIIPFVFCYFLPLNKKTFWVYILLMPIIAIAFSTISDYLINSNNGDEYLQEKLTAYTSKIDDDHANLLGIIEKTISLGLFYIPLFFTSSVILNLKSKININAAIITFYKLAFFIVLFATSSLLLDIENTVFFDRYLRMAMIPLAIVTVALYQKKLLSKKQIIIILAWGILQHTWTMGYQVYNYFR